MEFFSRYEALGIPLPDPETVCEGACEGTGWVPVYFPEGDHRGPEVFRVSTPTKEDYENYHQLWLEAESKEPADDGWHFLKCPDCKGTGKQLKDES